jgi:hypothetical protein
MKIYHHDLLIELDDDWWAEADMARFFATSRAYRAPIFYRGKWVHEVSIQEVGPVHRTDNASVFNDSLEEGSARERVLRLLRGFRANHTIPPIEVALAKPEYGYRYKLLNGSQRLYCSLAARFTHIPVVEFDF